MIAPLSDGNAHSIDSSTEAAVVKDEPHAGAKTGKGGSSPSPRPQGPAEVGGGDESSMPSAGATTGKCGSSRSPLELELIQPHMAQKPVLWGEVGCACVARGHRERREKVTRPSHCRCRGGRQRKSPGRRGRRGKVTGASRKARVQCQRLVPCLLADWALWALPAIHYYPWPYPRSCA